MANFKLFTGLNRMLNDAQAPLIMAALAIGVVGTIYFSIMKGMAEQNEQQMWEKRKRTLWIGVIIALVAPSIMELIQTYFG